MQLKRTLRKATSCLRGTEKETAGSEESANSGSAACVRSGFPLMIMMMMQASTLKRLARVPAILKMAYQRVDLSAIRLLSGCHAEKPSSAGKPFANVGLLRPESTTTSHPSDSPAAAAAASSPGTRPPSPRLKGTRRPSGLTRNPKENGPNSGGSV